MDELGGPPGAGVFRCRVQLRPGEAGGDVGGRVLPDGSLGARQPADVKAVQLDLLAGLRSVDVQGLGFWLGLSFVGVGVAGDQRQPF